MSEVSDSCHLSPVQVSSLDRGGGGGGGGVSHSGLLHSD